jgi:hypothetical protein
MYIAGDKLFQSGYYLIVFFTLLPIGYMLRNYNTLPLIFTFVVQTRLDVVAIRIGDFLK